VRRHAEPVTFDLVAEAVATAPERRRLGGCE
jgi:hypothetical protein